MPVRALHDLAALAVAVTVGAAVCAAQSAGTINGSIVLDSTGQPMHAARVSLMPLGRTTDSSDDGKFEFVNVPPGSYRVIARSTGLADEQQTIDLTAGATKTIDFRMRLAPLHSSVTVTATGREEATLGVIQSIASLDQSQLPLRSGGSLGDALENEPGVAKRSFGPGTTRPVIRGFDGNRVLIMEDGITTGSLSYQSGDHGEPIDVNKLEKLEVVRGPATLLYGSSAIGGVVNEISRHDGHDHAHQGVRGYLTALGGSNNALGGGTGGFEFGTKSWEFWGSGGGQRTGSYETPIGTVGNSQTRMNQTDAGLARYGEKAFASFNYGFTDSNYGIPSDPKESDPDLSILKMRRYNFRFNTGLKNVSAFESILLRLNYTDYNHAETIQDIPVTSFFNKQFVYRLSFEQKKRGRLSGSFGASGIYRDYKTVGEESIAPPTIQNGFSAFALETVDFERTRLQFGARVEETRYSPAGLTNRSFTGFSGSAGLTQRLWKDGAFVVNYSHSNRAPTLEELYNNGPHPGNLTFEIGNPNLKPEQNDGIDFSLRHQASRIHAELNFFYYKIHNFVYLAPTGNIEDDLVEADYLQHDGRFTGGEARFDFALHPNLWINLAADMVNARLSDSGPFLPRIPPVRGRVGFDYRYKGLSLRPELVLSAAQNKTFPIETPTAGFGVVNLVGAYTVARQHQLHIFSAALFNAGDNLYRNHLSFIKAIAPEIGRGVRVSYTVQFF